MLLVAGAAIAAVAATASSAGRTGSGLARPLHLPRVAWDAPCPVSRVDRRVPFVRRFGVSPGIGSGPAYPVGLPDGVLRLAPARNFHSRRWAGQKVLWFVLPSYRGPLLIRGARVDGPGRVRFEQGAVPPKQLWIRAGETQGETGSPVPNGARYLPSYTRLRGPGCYAYQIDGATFSRVVVFRATR